jgi:DNA-binding transcriptional regulator YhcF (GntR family)
MKAVSDSIPEATEPKYVWFASHLRRLIEAGELKPGDRLPSRTEIRAQHSITQPTIERAQAILEREGLIVRRERQGVFVADPGTLPVRASAPSNGAERLVAETIAIFSPSEGFVPPRHRQQGWSDYISQGALAACREHGKHALLLDPLRFQDEDLRNLLASPPVGFVFAALPSTLSPSRTGETWIA